MARKNKGFTLIELLVIVVLIGFLAAMVFVSVSYARKKGRDATRKSDLSQLRTAILSWNLDKNDWMEGSGCGYNGNGERYINHTYTGYTSIHDCLQAAGYLSPSATIKDPLGRVGQSSTGAGYYKESCTSNRVKHVFLMANLEAVPIWDGTGTNPFSAVVTPVCPASTNPFATLQTTATVGMNYILQVY